MIRIGQSTDIHQLVANRKLIIGGVDIPHEKGLLGHSDADVLVHAIAESMLGALALGDLGTHFSDMDEKYRGVSSLTILKQVNHMIKEEGYYIGNIDALIMIEKPKMAPYIDTMKQRIAETLECKKDQISIKATRGEGIGFIGREEGVQAQSIVLLFKK